MQLASKLPSREGHVLLYGTTPPHDNAAQAALRLIERIGRLPVDGLLVYDLQDESARTGQVRPFPFQPTVDSREYARLLRALGGQDVVCYKCIGDMGERAWGEWLDRHDLEFLTPVGRPTSAVEAGMALPRAIELASERNLTLGGVAIAERHERNGREAARMLEKVVMGCEFFVTQTVYNEVATIRLLRDYAAACRAQGVAPARVVLGFSPAGREKTLAFMKWLGVSIPARIERSILSAPAPLIRSIEVCCASLARIAEATTGEGVPLGVSVESISRERGEVDASVDLLLALREVLELVGSRERLAA